ncbi:MAG: ferritin family protein [candidate division KSB1 bacterium]|nr:ferritin family protein [candidate division KSB1 bacterium]
MTLLSRNEVIEVAVQIEREGKEFFEAVAEAAKSEEVRSVFQWLATEETRHMRVFEEMRDASDRLVLAGPYDWEEAGRYLKAMAEERVFPGLKEADRLARGLTDLSQVFRFALQIEKDNILYFHELRDLVSEGDRSTLNQLIAEEKSHIRRLMELRQKLL